MQRKIQKDTRFQRARFSLPLRAMLVAVANGFRARRKPFSLLAKAVLEGLESRSRYLGRFRMVLSLASRCCLYRCFAQIILPSSYNRVGKPKGKGVKAWEDEEPHPPIILPYLKVPVHRPFSPVLGGWEVDLPQCSSIQSERRISAVSFAITKTFTNFAAKLYISLTKNNYEETTTFTYATAVNSN